jgi:site-specific DNA-cytosine methylase
MRPVTNFYFIIIIIIKDSTEPLGKPPTNLIKCYENSQLSFRTRSKSIFSAIIDKNDFSRTILCSYGRMPRLFVPIKNKLGCFLRPYTISELQQIQGFPKSYIIKGKYLEKVNQIGNAIPPTFIQHVTNYIKDILNHDIIFI